MTRREMPSPRLTKPQFKARFDSAFLDPSFGPLRAEVDQIADAAWDAYDHSRKSPVKQKAGAEFENPEYELSTDWLAARAAIGEAEMRFRDADLPWQVLIINGSPRSEHTCPGETSKTWRLVELAKEELLASGYDVDVLDLSRLASEYGRQIHPCKACFSTAAPLCHWPCSCYPNYSLGQIHDWMNEIYPMWVASHGIMIVTPVHWYQVSAPLKLMMDRLVCADGGNPDPTRTNGKDAELAKRLELDGWNYPRHLAGRQFAVVAHGDAEGVENVRRALSDWLRSIGLKSAGTKAEVDRYVGYWKPYATSHDELDQDTAFQEEVRNAARALAAALRDERDGVPSRGEDHIADPRQK